jgi:hypothetical protein
LSGFEADLAGIGVTASVLTAAAESLRTAVDGLTGSGELGPGRLDQVVGALITGTREELVGVLHAVTEDAALVESIHSGYTAADEEAGAVFRRIDPW